MKNNIKDLSMKNKIFLTAAASVLALSLSTSAFAVPSFSLDLNQVGLAGGTGYVDGVTEEIGTFVGNSVPFPLQVDSVIETIGLLDEYGAALTQGFSGNDDIEGFGGLWDLTWSIGSGSSGALSIGETITVEFRDGSLASPQWVASLSITSLTLNAITDLDGDGNLDYASISAEFTSVLDDFWIFNGAAQSSPLDEPLRKVTIDANGASLDITAVPEPSLIALFGLGLVGMGIASRRRKQA
jgi:opacity protein-like surface antigen